MYVSILWCSYYYSPIYDVFKLQNKAIREVNDVLIMDNFNYPPLHVCQSRHFLIS